MIRFRLLKKFWLVGCEVDGDGGDDVNALSNAPLFSYSALVLHSICSDNATQQIFLQLLWYSSGATSDATSDTTSDATSDSLPTDTSSHYADYTAASGTPDSTSSPPIGYSAHIQHEFDCTRAEHRQDWFECSQSEHSYSWHRSLQGCSSAVRTPLAAVGSTATVAATDN